MFKFGKMIPNNKYMLKNISWIFHQHFDRVVYSIMKFIVEIQYYIKINDEKFIKNF
jgi:hypothetical protein